MSIALVKALEMVGMKFQEVYQKYHKNHISNHIVKPKSKSPIPCPNRPQILTLRSDQV